MRLTDDEIVETFARVRKAKVENQTAPNKPLLLLYALARLQSGKERWVSYTEAQDAVGPLIAQHSNRPVARDRNAALKQPFLYLCNDGIWELSNEAELAASSSHLKRAGRYSDALLRNSGTEGGFTAELDARLRQSPGLVNRVAQRILDDEFPPSMHDEILEAVGMPWILESVSRRPRDRAFRDAVLRAYRRRCAICGFDARVGTAEFGLEAAHIQWHAKGGPDEAHNGLALCSVHHRALDFGAIGIDAERRVLVSPDVAGGSEVQRQIVGVRGRPLFDTVEEGLRPRPQFTRWHREQVFRAG